MPLDPDYLRRHYAALSDEALLATDRADLVAVAQTIFDDEVRQRGLAPPRDARRTPLDEEAEDNEAELNEVEFDRDTPGGKDGKDAPDWLEEAAEVYSYTVARGTDIAPESALNAQEALEAAGIPCFLDLYEIPPEKSLTPYGTHRWRLMAPGKLNLEATNVIEREMNNPEFEAYWKTHLEALSNEELCAMTPEVVLCGLFDRIERVKRVYAEELKRRKLK